MPTIIWTDERQQKAFDVHLQSQAFILPFPNRVVEFLKNSFNSGHNPPFKNKSNKQVQWNVLGVISVGSNALQ